MADPRCIEPVRRDFVLNPVGINKHHSLRQIKRQGERDGTSLRKADQADFVQVQKEKAPEKAPEKPLMKG